MYRLYYSPGACSLAVHMVLRELEIPFTLELVSLADGQQSTERYKAINPKARVPALEVEGQGVLTEAQAIMTYLALRHSDKSLLPDDLFLQARAHEWMAWLAIEIHAVGIAKLWRAERFSLDAHAQDTIRADSTRTLKNGFALIENRLKEGDWALGQKLSIVDFYLLVFYRWGYRIGWKMDELYPAWTVKMMRLAERPSVIESLKTENIVIR